MENKFTSLTKNITKLALATVGLMAVTSEATAAPLYVGNSNPAETVYPYTGFNNSSEVGGTLHFAVKLDASKFDAYVGAKITGLRVGWSEGSKPMTPSMDVSVRDGLDGNVLASGKKDAMAFGYNDIMFDSPYIIAGGMDLYIGGSVAWEPDTWLATGIFYTPLPEKSQFFAAEEDRQNGKLQWQDVTDDSMGLLVFAIVEAEGSQYDDKATLKVVRANEFQSLSNPGNAYLSIANEGGNDLSSIEVTTALGDKTWSMELNVSGSVPAGQTKALRGGVQALGAGEHEVWLSKVNGKVVENPSKVKVNFIGVAEDVAKRYPRRPLIERWVSESEYRTPIYTDDWFMPGVEDYRDRVSLLSHHASDQFMVYHEFDTDVDCEDLQMLIDLAGGDKMLVTIPGFSIDRSYIPENPIARVTDRTTAYNFVNPDFVSGMYDAALATPSIASVGVEASLAGQQLNVTVKGDIEPAMLPADEQLYVSVCVLEDGIESTSQEFPGDEEVIERYNGKYTHNDVIRLQLTPMYGEAIGAGGAYEKTFTCQLDPQWNKDKLRVIAFVNRDADDSNHMQVLNSTELAFSQVGLHGVTLPVENYFAVDGRSIVALGDTLCEVYTLDGKRVSGSYLAPGVYLVKTAGATGTAVRKVVVK